MDGTTYIPLNARLLFLTLVGRSQYQRDASSSVAEIAYSSVVCVKEKALLHFWWKRPKRVVPFLLSLFFKWRNAGRRFESSVE
jgi:hypothetical protein